MPTDQAYDFVIVGSGAGGGPLRPTWRSRLQRAADRCRLDQFNDHYSVPAFHGLSTEDPS